MSKYIIYFKAPYLGEPLDLSPEQQTIVEAFSLIDAESKFMDEFDYFNRIEIIDIEEID